MREQTMYDKEKLIVEARKAKECFPDEEMQVSWLDAVPFDKDGNPTGEKNEYVINRGSYIIIDGLENSPAGEQEAERLLDYLQGQLGE